MPVTIISTDQTTTHSYSGASLNYLVLLEGVFLTVDGAPAVQASNSTSYGLDASINGHVTSFDLGANPALKLTGTSTGTVDGGGYYDIHIGATGTITSLFGAGIETAGYENIVTNYGSILALDSAKVAVVNSGASYSLRNHGTIQGGTGIQLNTASTTSTADVVNSGLIVGEDMGVNSTVSTIVINSGSITGSDDDGFSYGIKVNDTIGTVGSVIHNSGIIRGKGFSIDIATNDNQVYNSGTLFGIVKFGAGADLFDGRGGTVFGNVTLLDGNDIFDGRNSTIVGEVFGGLGDDTYIVDDANMLLVENAAQGSDLVKSTISFALADNFENLTLIGSQNINGIGNGVTNLLTGNHGDNILRGKAGEDTLTGKDGEDRLLGGSGADTLNGGSDNDVLRGGKGNDDLNGGSENDVLIGGTGKDNLAGGTGEDVFRFIKTNHSFDSGLADSILDFISGEDLIDLSALPGTLAFISGAFTGAAEVRVSEVGGNSIVRIDLDGDGVADMKIKVLGVTGLDALDFLL